MSAPGAKRATYADVMAAPRPPIAELIDQKAGLAARALVVLPVHAVLLLGDEAVAVGVQHLEVRLEVGIGRIDDFHLNPLRGSIRFQFVGDLEGEWIVTATVRAGVLAVYKDRRLPIDGPEVQ